MEPHPVDALIELDGRGVITEWNAAAERLFGWVPADAIGKHSHTIIPVRNRERHDQGLQAVSKSGRRVHSRRITALHKDGHEFTIDLAISIQERSDGERVVAVA